MLQSFCGGSTRGRATPARRLLRRLLAPLPDFGIRVTPSPGPSITSTVASYNATGTHLAAEPSVNCQHELAQSKNKHMPCTNYGNTIDCPSANPKQLKARRTTCLKMHFSTTQHPMSRTIVVCLLPRNISQQVHIK